MKWILFVFMPTADRRELSVSVRLRCNEADKKIWQAPFRIAGHGLVSDLQQAQTRDHGVVIN